MNILLEQTETREIVEILVKPTNKRRDDFLYKIEM